MSMTSPGIRRQLGKIIIWKILIRRDGIWVATRITKILVGQCSCIILQMVKHMQRPEDRIANQAYARDGAFS